ncbi:MAG TPA: FeoA family protein [Lacipirellula sp.]
MSAATLSPQAPLGPDTARPAVESMSLAALRSGEARVVRVDAEADDAARLMALGVCVGRRIEVVRAGDPMIVRVVAAHVGLSARLAVGVFVAAADQAASETTAA